MAVAEDHLEAHREAHREARTAGISPANRRVNLSLPRVLALEPCPQEAHQAAHQEAQEVRVEMAMGEGTMMMMMNLLHLYRVTMVKTMSTTRLVGWK